MVKTRVIDYVWDQVKGKRGLKTYDYDKLKNEIYDFVPEGDMISTEELINWAVITLTVFTSLTPKYRLRIRKMSSSVPRE